MGKRPARIEGQRCQNREHFIGEKCIQLRALFQTQLAELQQADIVLFERWQQIFPQEIVGSVDKPRHGSANRVQSLRWTPAVHTRLLHAVLDLLHDAGHAHHEELIDIGAENRQKLYSLQQVDCGGRGLLPALAFWNSRWLSSRLR